MKKVLMFAADAIHLACHYQGRTGCGNSSEGAGIYYPD